MLIDFEKEELGFLMRYCKRTIEIASEFGKNTRVFDEELGETIEKAVELYKKLHDAYQEENNKKIEN